METTSSWPSVSGTEYGYHDCIASGLVLTMSPQNDKAFFYKRLRMWLSAHFTQWKLHLSKWLSLHLYGRTERLNISSLGKLRDALLWMFAVTLPCALSAEVPFSNIFVTHLNPVFSWSMLLPCGEDFFLIIPLTSENLWHPIKGKSDTSSILFSLAFPSFYIKTKRIWECHIARISIFFDDIGLPGVMEWCPVLYVEVTGMTLDVMKMHDSVQVASLSSHLYKWEQNIVQVGSFKILSQVVDSSEEPRRWH